MVQEMVKKATPKMDAAYEHFQTELKAIRTGRVSPNILDNVVVMYYGTPTALRQLATVNVPDATQILVQPFDTNAINDLVVAIRNSDLGFNPSDDGRQIRIMVPALNAERREELVKKIGKIAEAARISVRNIRGEIWDEIQKAEKNSEISEDNRDWGRAEIDKMVVEYNKKIENASKEKETEIKTV